MSSLFATLIAIIFSMFSTFPVSQNISWSSFAKTPVQTATNQQKMAASTAVVLALDVSSYMDNYSLKQAKEAARLFIDKADSNTAIAIVTFASRAQVVQDYTLDKKTLLAVINGLKASGTRALYDGGLTAVNLAASASAPRRAVILMSNGPEYRYQSKATRKDVLELAKARNVSVFTVAIGSLVDHAYLKELAQSTNAQSYHIRQAAELVNVYGTLSAQLSNLANTTVATTRPTSPTLAPQDILIKGISAKSTTNAANAVTADTVPVKPTGYVKQNMTGSTAVVLAFDVSSNMIGVPLRKAKEAAHLFVDRIDGTTAVAIVTFGSRAQVVQDYTIDKSVLSAAIDGLKPGGNRALYDGGLAAINLAANSAAQRRIVILISNGSEYRYQSKATPKEAIALAKTRSVAVFTIGLGTQIDRLYLRDLAAATNAQNFTALKADELVSIYGTLGTQLATPMVSAATNNTIVDPNGLSSSSSASSANTASAGSQSGQSNDPLLIGSKSDPNLRPLNGSIPVMGVSQSGNANKPLSSSAEEDPKSNVIKPISSMPTEDSRSTNAVQPGTSSDPADKLASNVVPINVAIPDNNDVQRAELDVNGQPLKTFSKGPYAYDLDTSGLSAGSYTLTFTTTNANGVTSTGSLDFEVVVKVPTNTTSSAVTTGANSTTSSNTPESSEIINGKPRRTTATILTPAPRVLLINGKNVPFDLSFTADKGLTVIEPKAATQETPTESLATILSKPANLIPQPIKDALLTQRPTFWSIVIILMTIVLLPQGIFTLYWMMYTWNNPHLAEKYKSPKEYAAPQHSFTAILPARHEAGVIKDTIRAIDRIEYPDHLKEILVMIRDEDDDETIARAKEAIDEIGKDTIRLITFTTGPHNKPNGLNRGLKAASNEVICVFDAEDEPHAELYNVINTVMIRDNADVVQSGVQLMNFKSTWFSALNCLEYFFWFKSGLHAFTHALKVTPLGGNTVFFKKHWLQRIGGWDEHILTEDADVGIRLTQLGAKIQIVYDEKHATQEETPHNIESFIKQRTRWNQGFYEIFFKGDWLKLPLLKQKITALYILLNSLLQAAIVLFLPLGLYVALTQRIPVPVALISYLPILLLLLQLITNLVGIREFTAAYQEKLPFLFSAKMALVYYPYQLLLSFSAFRAVRRFLAKKNAWEKTAHSNLHRQPQPQPQIIKEGV